MPGDRDSEGHAPSGCPRIDYVALPMVQSGAENALLAWHALGFVHGDTVVCPDVGFRALVAEIDGCASLAALGAVGKRLYALALSHD